MSLLSYGVSLIPGTLMQHLGISWTTVELDRVVATMPVADATRQPFGLLHGGATAALIESAASMGAAAEATARSDEVIPLCTRINVEHLHAVRDGSVTATAMRRRDDDDLIWDVEVVDDEGRMVARGECSFVLKLTRSTR